MTLQSELPHTLGRQAELLRKREISPVDLARMYLERIERLQPQLNAFITVTGDAALNSARQAEDEIVSGNYTGPLHGVPISYKDIIATAGVRTTAGSKILWDNVPEEDAPVVSQLEAAGAISLGKTNLHEFAFGTTSTNEHFGPVRNPWNRELIPGGSSGGSAAAVAAGLSAASIGSDTGGSIRIPSSACGCVGLKPTYGLVDLRGVVPLSWSLDHLGPIAQTVMDSAICLDGLVDRKLHAFHDDNRSSRLFVKALEKDPSTVRLGVCPKPLLERTHPVVEEAVQKALRILEDRYGTIHEVTWPSLRHGELVGTIIAFAEASSFHEDWIRNRPEAYSSDLLSRLRMGLMLLATDYLRCQRIRKQILAEAVDLFKEVDILVYPTLPFVGAKIGAKTVDLGRTTEDIRTASLRFNRPANLIGYPAISLPCGFSPAGLPIGLQLMAPPYREALLLQVAHFYESETTWHKRRCI